MKTHKTTIISCVSSILCIASLFLAYSVSAQSNHVADGYIGNGGVFTPKGDLRIPIAFVSYGEPFDSEYIESWPTTSQWPSWARSRTRNPFYTEYSQFSANIFSDTNRYSVSNFYYQMSNGTFRVVADYIPGRAVISVDISDKWRELNEKAVENIKSPC